MTAGFGRVAAGSAVAISTLLVVVGAAIVLLFNPLWIGFEQGRANASAWTGWTPAQTTEVTNAVLHDLVIGPPDFAMTVGGTPVLDERERGHMRDVRRVFIWLGLAVLAAAIVLVATRLRSGGAPWFWRAVALGGVALGSAVVVLGAFFALAFDTAFELLHRLFFAGGTYSFDPATERLVQLFPEALWYETSIVLGALLLVAATAVAWFGTRRLAATMPTEGEGRTP